MAETPHLALLDRLRDVLDDQPVTETELRRLIEQSDGLVRTLDRRIRCADSTLGDGSHSLP